MKKKLKPSAWTPGADLSPAPAETATSQSRTTGSRGTG